MECPEASSAVGHGEGFIHHPDDELGILIGSLNPSTDESSERSEDGSCVRDFLAEGGRYIGRLRLSFQVLYTWNLGTLLPCYVAHFKDSYGRTYQVWTYIPGIRLGVD